MKEQLYLRLKSLWENDNVASTEQILLWSIQMAGGLQYILSRNVLQAGISFQNLLLDTNEDLKFADFSGSSIVGEDTYVCTSGRAQYPQFWQTILRWRTKYFQWDLSSTRFRLSKNPTTTKKIMLWKIFMQRDNSRTLSSRYSGLSFKILGNAVWICHRGFGWFLIFSSKTWSKYG